MAKDLPETAISSLSLDLEPGTSPRKSAGPFRVEAQCPKPGRLLPVCALVLLLAAALTACRPVPDTPVSTPAAAGAPETNSTPSAPLAAPTRAGPALELTPTVGATHVQGGPGAGGTRANNARPSNPVSVPVASAATAFPRATVEPTPGPPDPTPTTGPTAGARDALPPPGPGAARHLSPQVSANEVAALARSTGDFAFDLLRSVAEVDSNLFYSPYSLSQALAMAYAGAAGETEREMADALRLDLPRESLHRAFNALDQALKSRPEEPGGDFRLNVANSLWGQRGHQLLPAFQDVLAESYGEEVRLVDFRTSPDDARRRINRWVSVETGGRIKDLVPADGISADTRLVLANAIHFNAAWRLPFDEADTAPLPFLPLDGNEVEVPMMRQTASFDYLRDEGFQALELPYLDEAMAMTILLPDKGRFKEFESSLDGNRLEGILEDLQPDYLRLTMPKFDVASTLSVAGALKEMGMSAAFDPAAADFAGMDGRSCTGGDAGCLVISDVLHRALVSVDELGTEAAAATAVAVGITRGIAALPEPTPVEVDRPFIFLVRDRQTGAILFVGRFLRP